MKFIQLYRCAQVAHQSSKLYFYFRIVGRLVMPLFLIINSFYLKYILDAMTSNNSYEVKKKAIITFFLFLLIITLISSVIGKIITYIESMHQELITQHIQLKIIQKSLDSDYSLFDNAEYYDKMSQSANDSFAFSSLVSTFFDFVSSFFTILSTIIIVGSYNIFFVITVIVVAIPASLIHYIYIQKLYRLEQSQMNVNRQKNYLFDIATSKEHAASIRLYNIEKYLKSKYISLWKFIFSEKKKMIKKRTSYLYVFEVIPSLVVLFLSLLLALNVAQLKLSVGDYSLYTAQINLLLMQMFSLVNSITIINDSSIRIENVWSFNRIPNRVEDVGEKCLTSIISIEFENIYFTYPYSDKCILRNLSFKIQSGEKVAIVGMNGSGKSTIIKLLLRLYDCDSGSIKINGINIKQYTLESLREHFACYFQNEPNYAFTLKENIVLSNVKARENCDKVKSVIQITGINQVVNEATDGYDSHISKLFNSNGIELSGGQHQRLALSRTLYRDSSIIILDEPSSSLDPIAEKKLFEHIKSLGNDKIVIFTSHSLTNILLSNRLIHIENGVIIEEGVPSELLKHKGAFSELYSYQK